MERSRRRKHSDWKGEGRKIDEWFPHLRSIVELPNFSESVNDQMWAIGGFLKYRSTLPPRSTNSQIPVELRDLENLFCNRTNLEKERYDQLINMPQDDPVESLADIRTSLKATGRIRSKLLPGEELYPRNSWLGQYLDYTQETAAPRAYHFWMGVALLGSACRRNIYMERDYRLYPNQYLFMIGNTAEGKGIAFGKATPLMWKANDAVQRDMEEKDADLGPLPNGHYPLRKVVVLPDKPTPQYLVSALVPQNGSVERGLAVFEGLDSVGWLANEEVSSWLGKRSEVYEGCVHILTAFYNCDRTWSAGTHARGAEQLRNMCLTVICGSNMEWINKAVTPDMFAGGFIRRCLFICREGAPKRKFVDEAPPPSDPLLAHTMAEQLSCWMQLEEPLEVEIVEATKPLYSKFNREVERKKVEPEDSRLFYYYHGKYNFVMKLAMVLAVNRFTWPGMTSKEILEAMGSIQMKPEDLELAIHLVEHEEQYLPEAFARIGEHNHAGRYRDIVKIVRRENLKTGKPMKRGPLGRACLKSGMGGEWPKRLEEAIELEMVRAAKGEVKSGRPPLTYWDPESLDWKVQ